MNLGTERLILKEEELYAVEAKHSEVLESINESRLFPVYVLHGDEPVLMEEVREAIIRASGEAERYSFSSEDALEKGIEACYTPSLFSREKLVLVSTDGETLKKWAHKLERYLGAPSPDSRLVISVSSAAPWPAWLKSAAGETTLLVDCSRPQPAQCVSWLVGKARQSGKLLPPEVAELILETCERNLTWAARELEKLICYCGQDQQITVQHYRAVCTAAAPRVFEVVEAAIKGQVARALELCEKLTSLGENVEGLFGLLASEVRYMYKVKVWKSSGTPDKQIMEALGIQPFRFSRCTSHCSKFSLEELRQILCKYSRLDSMAKRGVITFEQALRMAVLYLAGKTHV